MTDVTNGGSTWLLWPSRVAQIFMHEQPALSDFPAHWLQIFAFPGPADLSNPGTALNFRRLVSANIVLLLAGVVAVRAAQSCGRAGGSPAADTN